MTDRPQEPSAVIADPDSHGPEIRPLGSGEVAWFSTSSPDKKGPNQDTAGIIELPESRSVLAVADGLGGQVGGADASARAIRILMESVAASSSSEESLRAAILDGFERANEQILSLGTGSGTTMVVVEIAGSMIRPFHVGDSVILATGQRGRLRLQTMLHSPVGYAVESGMLEEHDALHHEDRHVVSNIVGSTEMSIEVGSAVRLRPRDTVVLASDGLIDNLQTPEIVDIVRKGPLDQAAATLAQMCHRRMTAPEEGHPSKPDDLTFILFRGTPSADA
jgi:serine/threonine protein phosphatase PrpC